MNQTPYRPPWFLANGLLMTLYIAQRGAQVWQQTQKTPFPPYQDHQFRGAEDVPLFGQWAIPPRARGTLIGTYGITGNLEEQWQLQSLASKAYQASYAVVLFDWRAHGKSAKLSPTLTSDGLYEGKDFIYIAAQAKQLGCPAPFWLTGYSLGGQLALWGVKYGQDTRWDQSLDLESTEIGGGAVVCPSLDSNRSLQHLSQGFFGRRIDRAIARNLKTLANELQATHPGHFDSSAIARATTIRGFDQELVIERLGFDSVEAYYTASSPLTFLANLEKPVLIIYALDDPLFEPTIIPDLEAACVANPKLDLRLTAQGGHVGYISSRRCQQEAGDPDCWWAWNRVIEWLINQPVNELLS